MEFAKYIILLYQGREQAVTFPSHIQHADMIDRIRKTHPDIKPVSAGVFIDAPFWHGGESFTLGLQSRPQDKAIIQSALNLAGCPAKSRTKAGQFAPVPTRNTQLKRKNAVV